MASNTAQQTAADTTADELAIRNLIARLAQFADMAPIDGLDDYIACFTDDASWEMGDIVNRGREGLLEAARERRRVASRDRAPTLAMSSRRWPSASTGPTPPPATPTSSPSATRPRRRT